MNRFIYLLCFAFSMGSVHVAAGQNQQTTEFLFDVTTIVNDETQADDQRMAMSLLVGSLEAQGGIRNKKEGWLFMVGISKEDESGNVALSVSMYQKLPEPIVELGKKSEAFYMRTVAVQPASLDPAGKEVREYMSEEYMRQFVSPSRLYVELVKNSELQKGIDQIVGQFVSSRIRWQD